MYKVISDVFDIVYPHNNFSMGISNLTTELYSFLKKSKKTKYKVIDLCCGTGRGLSIWNRQDNIHAIGIDIDNQLLSIGHTNYPNMDFISNDILTIDFSDNNLDNTDIVTIFGVSILHFNSDERKIILKKVYDSLSDHSVFVFDLFSSATTNQIQGRRLRVKKHFKREDSYCIILFDDEKINEQYRHTHIRVECNNGEVCMNSESFNFHNIQIKEFTTELLEIGFSKVEPVEVDYKDSSFYFAYK